MMTLAAGVVPTQPYSPDSLLASHTDTPSYAKAAFARQRCNEGLILATGRGDTSPKHKRLAVPRLRFGLVSPRPVTGNQAPQHWTPISAERNEVTFFSLSGRLRILKGDGQAAQPGDAWALPVEAGLAEDRVVGPLVEMDHDAFGPDFDRAAGLDESAIQLLRLGLGKAVQARGQPAIAAVGDNCQGHV